MLRSVQLLLWCDEDLVKSCCVPDLPPSWKGRLFKEWVDYSILGVKELPTTWMALNTFKFLSPTFQVFFTLTRTHYTRTVAYSELCVDRLVYLLYKTMLLGWLRVFISVLMHAQSDQLRTDIPKACSLCIKRILICTHHPSLILYLSSSVPAEGHNMAGSFREALKVPDAPCCVSKHGAAVHKDAYCVPASVHAGVWINVFILRGLPELGFLTAGVHSHTYH